MNATMEKPLAPPTDKEAPLQILFVCTGNTCRSPMAAAVLNDLAKKESPRRLIATSAGLAAAVGAPITPHAAAALLAAGIPDTPDHHYAAHRARQVDETMLDAADLVVGMASRHAFQLMMAYPAFAGKITTLGADIADPFGGDMAVYRACLAEITQAIEEKFFGGDGA